MSSHPDDQPLVIFEDENVVASLSTRPSTPGEVTVQSKAKVLCSIGYLTKEDFVRTLLSTKRAAAIVKAATEVQRVALIDDGENQIRLTPLYGVDAEWNPVMDPHLEYHETYPGYVSSRSGPKLSYDILERAQAALTSEVQPAMDLSCHSEGDKAQNLFAKIIRGELEQWRIWESESHVAFLTPFGNTFGKTVLVPRKHLDSDILTLPESDFKSLACAVWNAMTVIMRSALKPDRIGLIFEGMEVDWVHAKLIPICGDVGERSEQAFTERYEGSVSSQPGPPASREELRRMLEMYRSVTGHTR